GDWKLGHNPPHFDSVIDTQDAKLRTARALTFDASELGTWDSSLLVFLSQVQEYAESNRLEVDRSRLPEQIGRLLALSEAVPERSTKNDVDKTDTAPSVTRIGTAALGTWRRARDSLSFTGEVATAIAKLPGKRVHMRWREFWVVVQSNS